MSSGWIAATISGVLALIGIVLSVWLSHRYSTRDQERKQEGENRQKDEDQRDNRLESIADRYRNLWNDERTRADQIEAERDTMAEELKARIDQLTEEVARLNRVLTERDTFISEQAQKIARLERQVKALQEHEHASEKGSAHAQ